jgi:hypothetical protein
MKMKELHWKEKHVIQNTGAEDSKGNIRVDKREIPKIWKNYITEMYDQTNQPENLEIELEEEDADKKGPYTLQCSGTSYQAAGEKKAARDNDVPADVMKLLGEDDVRIMTRLIKKTYKNGKWPKDFTEVTTTALKKKPKATKCCDHRTISLIAQTAKTAASILRSRIERKLSKYVEKISLNIEQEKELWNPLGC